MTAYLDAMRRYAAFSGRSTRSQFWLYHLTLLALALTGFIIDIAIAGPAGPEPRVSAVLVIAHYIPSLAIIVRRLHDSNRSGWLVLLCLIPLIGIIAFIAFGCTASTLGTNRFGPATDKGSPSATRARDGGSVDGPAPSAVERLEKAAALHAGGAITDTEFAKVKAAIIEDRA